MLVHVHADRIVTVGVRGPSRRIDAGHRRGPHQRLGQEYLAAGRLVVDEFEAGEGADLGFDFLQRDRLRRRHVAEGRAFGCTAELLQCGADRLGRRLAKLGIEDAR